MKFLTVFVVFLFVQSCVGFDLFGLLGGNKKKKEHDYAPVSDQKAKQYLEQFGYVGPSNVLNSAPAGMSGDFTNFKDAFKIAIRKFQEFAGLSPTGQLDMQTKKKMAEPRCGVFDVQAISTLRESSAKWRKPRLTYSILAFSNDLSQDDAKRAIRQAFGTWSEVVPLDFTEVRSSDETADIKIKFASHSHGDPWPFDGKSGVLAHATMPTSGLLHFDEDEDWTYMNAEKIGRGYVDVLAVAIHEIGHALGLDHSRDENSIMAPFYKETVDSSGNYILPKLTSVDITAIQDIYGPRRGGNSGGGGFRETTERPFVPATTTRASPRKSGGGLFGEGGLFGGFFGGGSHSGTGSGSRSSGSDSSSDGWSSWDRNSGSSGGRAAPNNWESWGSWTAGDGGFERGRTRSGSNGGSSSGTTVIGTDGCPNRLDAIADGPGSMKYVFSGGNVYEYSGGRIGKTHSLRLLFNKGPIYVDAALSNTVSNSMILFQGYNVFVFNYSGGKWILNSDYPKRVPSSIGFRPNGALLWIDGHQVLFSDSDKFAIYDEYWNQVTKVGQVSDYFPDFPKTVKGGYTSGGSEVKLFSRNRVYSYDGTRKMGIGQPQSVSSFFNC